MTDDTKDGEESEPWKLKVLEQRLENGKADQDIPLASIHWALEQIAALEARNVELSSAYKRCIDEFDDYERRKTEEIADLEKRNAELVLMNSARKLEVYELEQKLKTAEDALAAVRIYAKHSSHCALNDNDFPCTCGLDDLKERP